MLAAGWLAMVQMRDKSDWGGGVGHLAPLFHLLALNVVELTKPILNLYLHCGVRERVINSRNDDAGRQKRLWRNLLLILINIAIQMH